MQNALLRWIMFYLASLTVLILFIGAMTYERMDSLSEAVQLLREQSCDYYVIEETYSGTKYVMGPYQTETMANIAREAELSYKDEGMKEIRVQIDCDRCVECEK